MGKVSKDGPQRGYIIIYWEKQPIRSANCSPVRLPITIESLSRLFPKDLLRIYFFPVILGAKCFLDEENGQAPFQTLVNLLPAHNQ